MLAYARKHYGPKAIDKDTYLGFVNWANRLVRSYGKTTRAWSDGINNGRAVTVDPNVVLEHWYTHGESPQKLVDRGHRLMNSSWIPTYYILGGNRPDTVFGYEKWNPNLFQGGAALKPAGHSRNLGAKLHVWCDLPHLQTEQRGRGRASRPAADARPAGLGCPPSPPAPGPRTSPVIRSWRNPAWPAALHAERGGRAERFCRVRSGLPSVANPASTHTCYPICAGSIHHHSMR